MITAAEPDPENPVEASATPSTASVTEDGEDAALLRRASRGDRTAFQSLVDRHAQRLFRLAASLVSPTDAEDVLQEALIGAYRALGKFEGRSSVKTWLTRILVTQAAKWRRDNRRHRHAAEPAADPPAAEAGTGTAGAVSAQMDLQAALRQLSPDHQQVLVLRELEGLSYEEMADVLNVPRGTIESRLFRARAELREKLKAYLP